MPNFDIPKGTESVLKFLKMFYSEGVLFNFFSFTNTLSSNMMKGIAYSTHGDGLRPSFSSSK